MMIDYDKEWQEQIFASADELASLVNGDWHTTSVLNSQGKKLKRIVIEYEDPADY